MNEPSKHRSGRPLKYIYVAKHGRERHEGSAADIAALFHYSRNHIYSAVKFAEEFDDGIYRPRHAPGWEIWRNQM